ncbi:30S ribosomal protein S17 [uncultured archaeon]|nr:30S ribosomal protein S17 [uncultured archaeon]
MVEKKAKIDKKQRRDEAVIVREVRTEEVYPIRGNIFEGKVTSAKANKTVTVERELIQYIPKYERYRKIRSRIKAHNPLSINAKEGDWVKIGETRRISKTKSFIVMEVLKGKTQ